MSKKTIEDILLSDIVFDETIYPRKEHNPTKVKEYADNLETIIEAGNLMHIDSQNRLLDGRHRHLAYLTVHDGNDPLIKVYRYDKTANSRLLSIRLNSSHGQQLSQADKRSVALSLYSEGYTMETVSRELSVSKNFVKRATKSFRDKKDEEVKQRIFDMWLACHTQDEIAKDVDLTTQSVNNKIKTFSNLGQMAQIGKSYENDPNFKKPLYNVWAFAKKTNKVGHFGNSEVQIVDNLLYLYTQKFGIVVDLFGGGGSTIDICKKRLRRYWVGDRKPIIARQHEIRKHDIKDGLPSLRWSDVDLVYLDPPYWKQAEGQYSNSPDDLANMTLEQFTKTMSKLVKDLSRKLKSGSRIALIIQPTQWKAENKRFTDHVFDIINGVGSKTVFVETRISVPYSTEQYNAQQVNWAKESKSLLTLTREVIVWKTT